MSKLKMKELERKVEIQGLAHEQLLDSHFDLNARIQEIKRMLSSHQDFEDVEIEDHEVFEAFYSGRH